AVLFGLVPAPKAAGRTVEPMNWMNAKFAAFFTSGEKHLRTPGFANASDTRLNLGSADWSVEFWYSAQKQAEGVVFEIGEGPRGENDHVTRLSIAASGREFVLYNQPSGAMMHIPSDAAALRPGAESWHHFTFVYEAASGQVRHYVDGRLQTLPAKAVLKA